MSTTGRDPRDFDPSHDPDDAPPPPDELLFRRGARARRRRKWPGYIALAVTVAAALYLIFGG